MTSAVKYGQIIEYIPGELSTATLYLDRAALGLGIVTHCYLELWTTCLWFSGQYLYRTMKGSAHR
jgi:hypothetical protein